MAVVTEILHLETQGDCQVIDITPFVQEKLGKLALQSGIVAMSVRGSTGGLTTS